MTSVPGGLFQEYGLLSSISVWADRFMGRLIPGTQDQPLVLVAVFVVASAVLFLVGTLAPDMDMERSTLGRHFHIPVRHRGWTHTNWILLIFGVLAWLDPWGLCLWFFLGLASHLFLDELSRSGRVHWYPLTKYKVYINPRGDEVVVKRYWRGLYVTGSIAEYLLLGVLVAGALAAMWLVWLH